MPTLPRPIPGVLAALAATLALAACMTQDSASPMHGERHRQNAGGPPMMGGPSGPSGSGSTGAAAGAPSSAAPMDMQAMCRAYGRSRGAPAGQHDPMLEEQMKGMSPEMRARHMEMLRQHCH